MPLKTALEILYIEDDIVDQQFFLRTLKKCDLNASLHINENIGEAIISTENQSFDLVFSDFNLPDGDALDFLAQFNNNEIPVVVITSEADLDNATQSLKNGAFDFIIKDQITVAGLTRIINNIIRFKLSRKQENKLKAKIEENFANTKAIIDNTQDGIWSIDLAGKLLIANETSLDRFNSNFNYKAKIGDNFFVHLPEEISSQWRKLADIGSKGKVTSSVDQYSTKTGSFYLEVSCSPIYEDKKVTGVTFFVRDVTEKEKAAITIREQEQNFRAIFEGSSLPIMIEDLETNIIIDLNEACAHLHRYSRDEMIGMSIFNTIPPKHRKKANINYHKFLRGEIDELDSYVYRSDQTSVSVNISITEINYKNRGCNLLFFTDLTLRNEAKEELKLAKEIAERNDKFKSSFLATMSHEIRTPMAAVIGFTDLLKQSPLNEEQKEFVDIIDSSGKNLLVIINDILDLSKIQASKMDLRLSDFNLHETITRVSQLHSYKIDEKGLIYKSKIEDNVPQWVIGDEARIYQILNNLINNAIKFTTKGEIGITVNAKIVDADNFVLGFDISDTGIGIPSDKLDDIFKDFSQVDSSIQREQQGTGLGLSIVKGLVDLMQGNITVRQRINGGSEFSVEIPLKVGKNENLLEDNRVDFSKKLKGLKILVCEDNEINQMLIKKLLSEYDIELTFCNNGEIGVKQVKEIEPDIVFMDIQMPVLDGYEATTQIRTFSMVPIIAMSAHVMEDEREKCLEVGMNGFLSKPFKAEDLISFLNLMPQNSEKNGDDKWASMALPGLTELADGDESFIESILEIYIKNAAADIINFDQVVIENNGEKQAQIAHKFRSSFHTLNLNELNDLALKIESKSASEHEIKAFSSEVKKSIEIIKEKLRVFKGI